MKIPVWDGGPEVSTLSGGESTKRESPGRPGRVLLVRKSWIYTQLARWPAPASRPYDSAISASAHSAQALSPLGES